MNTPESKPRREPPQWRVVKGFVAAILIGTFLLSCPAATRQGTWNDPLVALFTATSAVCVTGLTVADPGSMFSPFGQWVILALIQGGGLGIMTIGTFLLLAAGRRLSMRDEFVLMDSLGHETVRGLRALLVVTLAFTLLIEAVGASVLAARLGRAGYASHDAVYYGVFHAVSAFCNAGFSLLPDSLVSWRSDPALLTTIMVLVVLGGLGFPVLYNLASIRFWKRDRVARGRLSLHSRLVLFMTLCLTIIGWVAFAVLEWDRALSPLPAADRLLCALFQSITPRTAGFNVVDMTALHPATNFMTMLLMFLGGSSASAAGGIKITTFAVLILTAVAMVRGNSETELREKTIPTEVVREALSIFLLSLLWIAAFFALLLVAEYGIGSNSPTAPRPDALLFEVVSAFGTVGLSMGVTPNLSVVGKLCLVACMFIGRLGPIALALTIGTREPFRRSVRYPEEDIVVG